MVNGLDPLLCDRGLNGVDVMVSPGGVNGGGRRGPGGEDISEESSANGIWGWEENDEEGTPCSPASPRCLITSFIDRMTVAQNKVNLVGLMGGISSEAGSRELIFTLDNMRDVEAKELDADTSDTESFFSDKGSTKDPSHLSVRLLAVECSPSCWRLEVNDGTGRNSNFTFPKSVVAKKDAALEVRFTFSDDPQRKPELDIHLMESQAVTPAVPRQEMDKEVQTVIALGVEQIGEECRNSSAEITVEVRIPKEAEAKTPESVVREVDVKEMEEESSVDSKIRSVQEKLDKFSEKVNILSDIVTTREESEVGKADYSPKTSSEVPRKANVVCKALKKVELEIAPLRRELIDLHNKMLDVQGPFDVTDKRLAPTYTAHRYTDSLKEFYKSIGYEPRYSLPDEDTRSGYSLDKSSVYEDARSTCSRREGDWGLPLLQDMYSRLADLARTRPVEEDARSQVSSLSSTSTLVQARYPKAVKRKASYRLCLQDPMWSEPEDIFGDCESFLGDPWAGLANGMDLAPGAEAASPPIPFHHITTEKAKSFIALQELQNEVGALLEFRDVVMETFPQLRGKLSGRCCRWEPGVRVRKKAREETSAASASSTSQPRSRSNSRSKVGGGGGSSGIQDSGFCTESKKTTDQEAEDELWNLLDLIHTKGTKLRLEVESLQDKYQSSRRSRSLSDIPGESDEELRLQILGLRQEKEMLLDRVTEMEAENLANLAQTNQLLAKLGALAAEKRDIEQQLRAAVSTKTELNSRIHDLHSQFVVKQKTANGKGFTPVKATGGSDQPESRVSTASRKLDFGFDDSPPPGRPSDPVSQRLGNSSPKQFYTPQRPVPAAPALPHKCYSEDKVLRTKLGRLDGILSSPRMKMTCPRGVTPDKEKTAAILREADVVELQRHLITTTYENQVAQHRLERLNRCRTNLSQQLDKFKEENDDLKFQLEEKSIELEATKARIRLLEKPLQAKNPALAMATAGDGGDGVDQCSSSTESAHQEETSASKRYHQPSRIPLKSGKKPPPSGGATPPARGTPPARQQQGPAVPRRPRKSSESSFNSTSSSPSVRTPPPPYSKKTPAAPLPPVRHLTNSPAERIVAESEPKIREFKVGSVSELPRGPCCGEGRNYAADSLEHMSCCGELDRSIGSAVATWSARHHSLDYFDSIDSSPLLNEALADYDSLNQMTSDMV